jgi:uncharacterized membrane protein
MLWLAKVRQFDADQIAALQVGMQGLVMPSAEFSVMTKPNCSMSVVEQRRGFAVIAGFALVVATGFSLAGAWLVMPFAGIELLALAAAFSYLNGCSEDYESISLSGDSLVLELRSRKQVERIEFNRYWVRVMLKVVPGGMQRLCLCSHGREVEFGRYMNDQQRLALAHELKRMTGSSYR